MTATEGPRPGALEALRARLGRPIDAASLAAFRVLFGLLMLGSTIRFAARGWIDALYVAPELHFHYWGLGWVEPLSALGMRALFVGLGGLSILIALGLFYRPAIALFFVLFTYVEVLDKAVYLNHYYFISALSLLMIALPLERGWSLDARRRPALRAAIAPTWALWALRLQVGLVYFFAGVAKLRVDWLLHGQPLRLWLAARDELPIVGPLLRLPETALAMSWAGALFDLTVPFLLLGRRTRPFAYAAVLIFHGLTGLLFPEIGVFPWVMSCAALVFFDPAWPRRLWARVAGRGSGGARMAEAFAAPPTRAPGPLLTAALALFFALQLALPLRRLAYPGETAWTEEGFRFAWQVMLVEKTGMVTFRVRDPASGREWLVDPEPRLSAMQAKQMAFQPDMILEMAQVIAREEAARGRAVEVRADAFVAYNGRPNARLIDPDVDLARERDTLAPKPWILPAPPRR
ncbi:MAG: HTTM domain-containing protein [Myxococcales bacterium]|nr:HTTM domain-containing protein [Myxococcales bacterium]